MSKTAKPESHLPDHGAPTPVGVASTQSIPSSVYQTSLKTFRLSEFTPPIIHILPSKTSAVCPSLGGKSALAFSLVQFTPSSELQMSSTYPPALLHPPNIHNLSLKNTIDIDLLGVQIFLLSIFVQFIPSSEFQISLKCGAIQYAIK